MVVCSHMKRVKILQSILFITRIYLISLTMWYFYLLFAAVIKGWSLWVLYCLIFTEKTLLDEKNKNKKNYLMKSLLKEYDVKLAKDDYAEMKNERVDHVDVDNNINKNEITLDDTNNTLWKSRILLEHVYSSEKAFNECIVMYYDLNNHGFVYYCNSSFIPHDILNRIASKYVTIYRCKSFYIENKIVPIESKSESESANEQLKAVPFRIGVSGSLNLGTESALKRRSVFVKGPLLPIHDKTINHFIRGGKFQDFSFLQKNETIIKNVKDISWGDYNNKTFMNS